MLTQEQKGEKAFEMVSEVITNEAKRRELFLRNMEILKIVEFEGLYKLYLGDPEADFKALLADPKIYYPRAKVLAGLKILDVLLAKFHLGTISDVITVPIERLGQIVKFAIDETDAHELFEKAELLHSGDWNALIKERQGKPAADDGHEHVDETIKVCEKCGRRKKSNA